MNYNTKKTSRVELQNFLNMLIANDISYDFDGASEVVSFDETELSKEEQEWADEIFEDADLNIGNFERERGGNGLYLKRKTTINPDIVREWSGDWITDGQVLAIEDALRESDIEPHQYFRIKNFSSPDQESAYIWERVNLLRSEIRPGMEPHSLAEEQIKDVIYGMIKAAQNNQAGHGKKVGIYTEDKLEEIAKRNIPGIETLKTRKSDSLDFHNVAVWQLKSAIKEAGRDMLSDGEIEEIAKTQLYLDTLKTRNLDSLDFSEQSVWGIKSALQEANHLGVERLRNNASRGTKIENMENYYYLKIGNVIKEKGLDFKILSYEKQSDANSAGIKVKRISEIETNITPVIIPFENLKRLMHNKDIKISHEYNGNLTDLPYGSEAEKFLLQMEIENIKKSFEVSKIKTEVASKTEEIKQVKKEADELLSTLEKSSADSKATLDALEAIVNEKKSGWQLGTVADYNFEAKVFDEPSEYGINNGRVSKLWVYKKVNGNKNTAINYDRGWDIKPTTVKDKRVLKSILDLFPNPNDKAGKGKMVGDFYKDEAVEIIRGKHKGEIGHIIEIGDGQIDVLLGDGTIRYLGADDLKKTKAVDTHTQKLEAFLDKFPDNAKSWADATDEMRDLARETREYYNDSILNVTEGDKGYVKAIDFSKIKTPSEWNKKAKAQIRKLWVKMKPSDHENLLGKHESWFN